MTSSDIKPELLPFDEIVRRVLKSVPPAGWNPALSRRSLAQFGLPTIVFKHLHESSCLLQTNLASVPNLRRSLYSRSLYICTCIACISDRHSRSRFPIINTSRSQEPMVGPRLHFESQSAGPLLPRGNACLSRRRARLRVPSLPRILHTGTTGRVMSTHF
jgi:hypothetical protein